MMVKKIRGFKAYNKGMKCMDFQYEEGEIYELKTKPSLCESGFHFCENPLDVLDYYNLCDSEFSTIESLGDIDKRAGENKVSTNKIKIGFKLDFKAFVETSVEFIKSKTKIEDSAQMASSGDSAQMASSGYYAQMECSGDSAKMASSGYSAHMASSGDYAQMASSGDYAQMALNGSDSVGSNISRNGKIKGKIGSWVTLAEYKNNKPLCVKSAQIDGKVLKADTWYTLKNGEFEKTS